MNIMKWCHVDCFWLPSSGGLLLLNVFTYISHFESQNLLGIFRTDYNSIGGYDFQRGIKYWFLVKLDNVFCINKPFDKQFDRSLNFPYSMCEHISYIFKCHYWYFIVICYCGFFNLIHFCHFIIWFPFFFLWKCGFTWRALVSPV